MFVSRPGTWKIRMPALADLVKPSQTQMKNSPLKQAFLLTAALTVLLGLGACQTAKNAAQGGKCEDCADCEKSSEMGSKKPSSK
jgi:hypothetical protein